MQLPVDVLDHIFSFLLLERKTLIACSKDPVLSPIVERHAYHHIIIQFGVALWKTNSNDPLTFRPDNLSKIVSEKPHIVHSVRILQIQIDLQDDEHDTDGSDFAKTLLMFPVLECIMLAASKVKGWRVLDPFRAALEDRLSLPTLKEIHFRGGQIPISLLNSKNIEILQILSWSLENPLSPSNLPQPHSLRFLGGSLFSLLPWVKLHSKELRSFKSILFRWKELSEVLEVCSGTLNKLDIALRPAQLLTSVDVYGFWRDLRKLPPVLPSLQQLIIRTSMNRYHQIWLPVVTEVANLFLSSLRHLSIDIDIDLPTNSESDLTQFKFSPLADLGTTSRSVPRIDLFVHTGVLAPHTTRAHIQSSLEVYEELARSIKEGILIIHPEKIAPECV